jgi:hypothetical protein
MKYRHTQIGWITLIALCIGLALMLFVFGSMTRLAIPPLGFVALIAIFTALIAVFSSLTTEVDAHEFRAKFGVFGWPGLSAELTDIAGVLPTRLSWTSGWGIRITTRGWLYNVSGRGAVIVGLVSGKQFLIGTDEPEKLADAINQALGRAPVFTFIRGAGVVAE